MSRARADINKNEQAQLIQYSVPTSLLRLRTIQTNNSFKGIRIGGGKGRWGKPEEEEGKEKWLISGGDPGKVEGEEVTGRRRKEREEDSEEDSYIESKNEEEKRAETRKSEEGKQEEWVIILLISYGTRRE